MEQQINITIGTAGHVDHGKTALVKLLTGCDTDTLKAEKERGLSIDLGFAPCTVSGIAAGIVDVPGHEHFVKTMVAGASGMDAVILVVAADDGVMPQTREHFDILTLLGVEHGLVALTKIDRVTREEVERRRGELEQFLRGTFLEGTRICPISNVTGDGFDGFYNALSDVLRDVKPKSGDGVFRMPVDRAFAPKGFGTVVTGVPVSGRARVGDEVALLPDGTVARINAIQVYGEDSEEAIAGQCAALNVRRFEHKTIERGNVVALPGYFEPQRWFACKVRLLPGAPALKNGASVKFHTGTSEATANVHLMKGERASPGEEHLVQVRAERPLVAGPADRFIIRGLSPVTTVGGGMIIEPLGYRLRRTHPGAAEDLAERAAAVLEPQTFAAYCLAVAGDGGVTAEALARRIKATPRETGAILAALESEGRTVALGGVYLDGTACAKAVDAVIAAVQEYHKTAPESTGVELEALREATGLGEAVFEGLIGKLEGDGRLKRAGGRVALAEYEAVVPDADRAVFSAVEAAFKERLFAPPRVDDVIAKSGFEAARVRKAVGAFLERGILVRVAEGLFFHAEAVEEARRRLEEYIRREGRVESVKFKYLLDTTRKYAIPLLDYFDSVGVTVRAGNTRYLRER